MEYGIVYCTDKDFFSISSSLSRCRSISDRKDCEEPKEVTIKVTNKIQQEDTPSVQVRRYLHYMLQLGPI